MKNIYENLRKSKYWEDTLLLITYDEHGGFYDKIPPTADVPNPSPDKPGIPYHFAYDRVGVRVPSIAISPWLAKSVDSTEYEHASVPATVRSIFNLTSDFLNARDRHAN